MKRYTLVGTLALAAAFIGQSSLGFYNPATGLFSTTRPGEGFEPLLREPQLQELKQKLNQYDERRRAAIAQR